MLGMDVCKRDWIRAVFVSTTAVSIPVAATPNISPSKKLEMKKKEVNKLGMNVKKDKNTKIFFAMSFYSLFSKPQKSQNFRKCKDLIYYNKQIDTLFILRV